MEDTTITEANTHVNENNNDLIWRGDSTDNECVYFAHHCDSMIKHWSMSSEIFHQSYEQIKQRVKTRLQVHKFY